MFEFHDPYHDDKQAQKVFGKAAHLAQQARAPHLFYYRQQSPQVVEHMWQMVHPHEIVVAADNASQVEYVNPDSIRYERAPHGRVIHLHKHW
jgi:hypothetical protein